MPRNWGPNSSPLLSGLFGAFQGVAAGFGDTQTLWQALRVNAALWQFQAQGGGELPPVDELESAGAQILSEQGVGIENVNTYRQIAGQWRSAKANLMAANEQAQITSNMIFTPPWATTTDASVPSRYRIRVQWQWETPEGEAGSSWGTYELNTPLTNISDALEQASQLVSQKPTSDTPLGALVTQATDYEIEQV